MSLPSKSGAYLLDSADMSKNLRDLAIAVGGAVLASVGTWLSGYGTAHPEALWVGVATAGLIAATQWWNRFSRDNTKVG